VIRPTGDEAAATQDGDGHDLPLLRLIDVKKRFGKIDVLRGVNLEIGRREAVGLIGDNGAGKSTLVKILSGVHAPTDGIVEFEGRRGAFATPLAARAAGIEMIYQDLALCDDLDASSNIFLGREPRSWRGGFRCLDRRRMSADAEAVLDRLGVAIRPDQLVASMSGGERQLVAVARAMQFSPRMLLMDEPTAALSNAKIHMLLNVVNGLKHQGVSVLLISHRFTDLLEICDRIVALRDGRIASEIDPRSGDAAQLVPAMQAALTGDIVDSAA
jgi:ABC-type sugar transport system ATPase subunit